MRQLQVPPGSLPVEVFQARATGEKTPGRTQKKLEAFLHPAWPGNALGPTWRSWRTRIAE